MGRGSDEQGETYIWADALMQKPPVHAKRANFGQTSRPSKRRIVHRSNNTVYKAIRQSLAVGQGQSAVIRLGTAQWAVSTVFRNHLFGRFDVMQDFALRTKLPSDLWAHPLIEMLSQLPKIAEK